MDVFWGHRDRFVPRNFYVCIFLAKRPATPRSPRTAQLYQDWKKLKAVPLFGSTLECIMRVVHEEGWQGLYTGVQSSVTGVGISSFVYFYWYVLHNNCL